MSVFYYLQGLSDTNNSVENPIYVGKNYDIMILFSFIKKCLMECKNVSFVLISTLYILLRILPTTVSFLIPFFFCGQNAAKSRWDYFRIDTIQISSDFRTIWKSFLSCRGRVDVGLSFWTHQTFLPQLVQNQKVSRGCFFFFFLGTGHRVGSPEEAQIPTLPLIAYFYL